MSAAMAMAEAALGCLAEATTKRDQLLAEQEAAVAAARARFQDQIVALEDLVAHETETLLLWAEANRKEHFAEKKSLELAQGTIGWRTGPWATKTVSRKWTWGMVREALKKLKRTDLIRTKEEPDREAMIARREDPDLKPSEFGVKIEQEETFFVEPRKEQGLGMRVTTRA